MAAPSIVGRRAPAIGDDSDEATARLDRSDRVALALLVGLAVIGYFPELLARRIVVPGDDLIQNLPLRVLTGQLIRSGHLPAWDPLIWSGTPLLAGWNAGALFPGTLLFAFLPNALAWVIISAAAPALDSTGTFLLLRRLRVGAVGATVGALVFTYTGFLSGQFVHLGLEQGAAMLPWTLLAIHVIAGARDTRGRVGGIALLGAAFGATLLAGDPRAVSSAAIAAILYTLAFIAPRGVPRLRLAADVVAGAVLGVAIGAVQLLPGLTFLSGSQRSTAAYPFFTTGSIGADRLVTQLLVPFLFGGNGNFGLPLYAGDLNLPEVTIGCGLVALIAAIVYWFELLGRIRDRLIRIEGPEDDRHLGVLYVMALVGLLLTLGGTLPLAHLTVHIPLFGSERLQNRNAEIFDLPLAFLVAYLVHDLGVATSPARAILRSWRQLLMALPIVGAAALCASAWASPQSFARRLRIPTVAGAIAGMHPYYLATIVLGLVVTAAVLVAARLPARRAVVLGALAVVADVGMYAANASYASTSTSSLASSTPLSRALDQVIGNDGRFALYNPGFESPGSSADLVNEVGLTDLNIIHGDPSVQGYGSIVSGSYQNETQTHGLEQLSLDALRDSTADALDLRGLVTLPVYFQLPIATGAPIPLSVSPGVAIDTSGVPGLPPYFSGPWPITNKQTATFTLASPTALKRATIVLLHRAAEPTRLGVIPIGPTGPLAERSAAVRGGVAQISLGSSPVEALEVVDPGASAEVGAVVATTTRPSRRLLLDGALQGAVIPPHWRYASTISGFTVWENSSAIGLAWLQTPTATTADPARRTAGIVQVQQSAVGAPQTVIVHSGSAAQLVRAEGFSGGWTARLQPLAGGPTRVLSVKQIGLVQVVSIPKGNWRVTFRYAPLSLLLGVIGSAAGLLVLLALIGWFIRRRIG